MKSQTDKEKKDAKREKGFWTDVRGARKFHPQEDGVDRGDVGVATPL